MTPETWLADLGRAADELGYGISVIEPGRIELHPYREHEMTVVIRGVFLSGDSLRKYLRNLKADWLENAIANADAKADR